MSDPCIVRSVKVLIRTLTEKDTDLSEGRLYKKHATDSTQLQKQYVNDKAIFFFTVCNISLQPGQKYIQDPSANFRSVVIF